MTISEIEDYLKKNAPNLRLIHDEILFFFQDETIPKFETKLFMFPPAKLTIKELKIIVDDYLINHKII